MRRPDKIISGGQTGVDRAALDFAIERGIAHSGWCPAGRKAEDGPLDARYHLRETRAAGYWPRTVLNVRDCTSALVVFNSRVGMSPGTHRTIDLLGGTRRAGDSGEAARPFYEFDLNAYDYCMKQLRRWLAGGSWSDRVADLSVLNIAGPRESKAPGIYAATLALLREVWP